MVVTIDGPAGCGKSTVAKQLARVLGLTYLDTGATYRTLAYVATLQHVSLTDEAQLAEMAWQLPFALEMTEDGGLRVLLNGRDISKEIRTEAVTEAAAVVSQYAAVRAAMVARQRKLAAEHGVVVEGRDTGSVVFPQALFKFFLTASPRVRAKRRQAELRKMYGSASPLKFVQEQLEYRDGRDTERTVGPLVKPADAVEIDTTRKSVPGVVQAMLKAIRRRAA